jgi:membrane protease YdiL (CAAX protease family)
MALTRPHKIAFGLVVSAGIALLALYSGARAPLPEAGFVPSSFVTHTVMLGLSLLVMWRFSGGRLADFGFTRGTYRFRPTILLWVLPTAVLSLLSTLAPGGGANPDVLGARSELQLVLFTWIYASVCEEVLTRGLLQTLISDDSKAADRRAIFNMPVVVSALFFGAMHLVLIDSMGPFAVVPIVLATLLGLLAARYRQVTGSLVPAIIVHALFNIGGMLPGWILDWLTK